MAFHEEQASSCKKYQKKNIIKSERQRNEMD
jgi:hypothetical protein